MVYGWIYFSGDDSYIDGIENERYIVLMQGRDTFTVCIFFYFRKLGRIMLNLQYFSTIYFPVTF